MVREKKSSPLAKNKKAAEAAQASKSSSSSSSASAPPPPTAAAVAPVAAAAQPKQPGLLGQVAATAGGVAIGSSVGHAVGNMFGGGGSKSATEKSESPKTVQFGQSNEPCEFELRQLMDCVNRQPELNACQTFFETLKQCRATKVPQKEFERK